jgi:hypothetical protein
MRCASAKKFRVRDEGIVSWSERKEGRMAKQEELVEIKVGFNQQQRQLIEKIKKEKNMGESDTEVIRAVFVQWLKEEGLL